MGPAGRSEAPLRRRMRARATNARGPGGGWGGRGRDVGGLLSKEGGCVGIEACRARRAAGAGCAVRPQSAVARVAAPQTLMPRRRAGAPRAAHWRAGGVRGRVFHTKVRGRGTALSPRRLQQRGGAYPEGVSSAAARLPGCRSVASEEPRGAVGKATCAHRAAVRVRAAGAKAASCARACVRACVGAALRCGGRGTLRGPGGGRVPLCFADPRERPAPFPLSSALLCKRRQ